MKFIILDLKVSKSLYINHEFENDLENCLLKKIYCQAFSDISYLWKFVQAKRLNFFICEN